MNILVIGSGGREHALIWKLAQSERVDRLYCAPGNGGIADLAECVPIRATDIDKIVDFVNHHPIDMTVVAPDDPLALGLVDRLAERGHRAFGPTQAAARIESSKAFSKDLMRKYNIPTAAYQIFDQVQPALEYLEHCDYPIVVKADGLALGKGVVVAQDRAQAQQAVQSMMVDQVFAQAGRRVVIEECLIGPEVTALTFVDGQTVVPMPSSQDHKRAFDDDQGLNTGGMGAFSPSQYYTADIAQRVHHEIMIPTVKALQEEGCPFRGILYFGLMLTQQGPKVIEYNARFGDPETQALMPLLKTDLVDIFDAIIDGKLHQTDIQWQHAASACIVLASGGYPGKYETGFTIQGLDRVGDQQAIVFHAGTCKEQDGRVTTAGGRVLGVTAVAGSVQQAAADAYLAASQIHFEGMHFRRDIGIK